MRTREVCVHAVDLDNGAVFSDFPAVVQATLLDDIVGHWRAKQLGAGLVLAANDEAPLAVDPAAANRLVVRGSLPALVRWAAGRGAIGLSPAVLDQPPQWI